MPISLIKNGQIIADTWIDLEDGGDLPENAPVIVPLTRWQAERETLQARAPDVGVRLNSDQFAEEIADDLEHLALIAIEFPSIADGRGYTTGRLMRERYGFTGELRAVGPIMRDAYPLLHRCGFDAVEALNEKEANAWAAAVNVVSVAYQPASDSKLPAPQLRHLHAVAAE